jgi:hypothetical protein
VFKVFAEESVGREGRFTPSIDADLKELSVILCMGAKESGEVRTAASVQSGVGGVGGGGEAGSTVSVL